MLTRQFILARLREYRDQGVRDPELLYLGGRYAASLGMEAEACRFLDPLAESLRQGERTAEAFFPVGLLYLQVLGDETRRADVTAELLALAERSPTLRGVASRIGLDPLGRIAIDSPHHLLGRAARGEGPLGASLLALADPAEAGGTVPSEVASARLLDREATEAYSAGDLGRARRCLESLLVLDGDQPDVIRNLLVISSEQQDSSAYDRHWRSYVKALLGRALRGDGALSWADLAAFYTKVAAVTDREFSETLSKTVERLKRPGVLARWLEAHAGLAWLVAADRSRYDDLKTYWFRVFYPEFRACLRAPGQPPQRDRGHAAEASPTLQFDPGQRLLGRFLEWRKFGFGLGEHPDAHTQTVVALAGCVARLPAQPHVLGVRAILDEDRVAPTPLRRALLDATSQPIYVLMKPFLTGDDLAGMADICPDQLIATRLVPALRLQLALAYCQAGRHDQGFDLAVGTLTDMNAEEFRQENGAYRLLAHALDASLFSLTEEADSARRRSRFEAMRTRLAEAPEPPYAPGCGDLIHALRVQFDEHFETLDRNLKIQRFNEVTGEIMKQVEGLVAADKFDEAQKLVATIPAEFEEASQFKADVAKQIGDARLNKEANARFEQVMKELQGLVSHNEFNKAHALVATLPDEPSGARKAKENVARQVREAEAAHSRHQALEKQISQAVERAGNLASMGDFQAARGAIHSLPDFPPELVEMKAKFLGQIKDIENQSRRRR